MRLLVTSRAAKIFLQLPVKMLRDIGLSSANRHNACSLPKGTSAAQAMSKERRRQVSLSFVGVAGKTDVSCAHASSTVANCLGWMCGGLLAVVHRLSHAQFLNGHGAAALGRL